MPIEVDAEKRLDEIAEATLRVAERDGPAAITIRAVAAELGGSTAVVTNYVASRADLLRNVILHAQREWREDMARRTEGLEGRALLEALVLWSAGTVGHDRAVRHLWLDMASKSPADSPALATLQDDALQHHGMIRDALRDIGSPDADVQADVVYLMLRGFYFLSVEDPARWTDERVADALRYALECLAHRPADQPTHSREHAA